MASRSAADKGRHAGGLETQRWSDCAGAQEQDYGAGPSAHQQYNIELAQHPVLT